MVNAEDDRSETSWWHWDNMLLYPAGVLALALIAAVVHVVRTYA